MMQQQVIQAALNAWRRGEPGALGTIVAVEGSAYQREGASVFVNLDGSVQGLISGGCLESEVAGEAQSLRAATPRVLRYDTSDESIFGYGMGCPGIVDVLLEKLPPGESPLQSFLARIVDGMPAARGVRLDSASSGVLQDIVYIPGRGVVGSLGAEELDAQFLTFAQRRVEEARAPEGRHLDGLPGTAEVFAWIVPAEAECVIFGATDDARPLAQMAREIGLKVRLVDPRRHLATEERFPGADVHCVALQDYQSVVELDSHSYVVVMGHQVESDLAALSLALQTGVPYIGLLSSQGRRDSMLAHLRADGLVAEAEPPALRSPAGLWIGARTPEEIALSIVAEICSVRRQAATCM